MAQDVLRALVHEDDVDEAPAELSRAALLTMILMHDRRLRVLLGSRRAHPVEEVRETWRRLLSLLLHRLPASKPAPNPIYGLTQHMDALRAAGVPTDDIIAAVSRWRMGRA